VSALEYWDHPLEHAIGLAEGETQWRMMTVNYWETKGGHGATAPLPT
jgi:hypothetical protein